MFDPASTRLDPLMNRQSGSRDLFRRTVEMPTSDGVFPGASCRCSIRQTEVGGPAAVQSLRVSPPSIFWKKTWQSS